MMKKVYICAPLSGDIEGNIEKVKRYARFALLSGTAPVVPHYYASSLNDTIPKERELGITAGLGKLWFCDELWIFGDEITKGMETEIRFCKNLNIKIRKINEEEISKRLEEETNEKENT